MNDDDLLQRYAEDVLAENEAAAVIDVDLAAGEDSEGAIQSLRLEPDDDQPAWREAS